MTTVALECAIDGPERAPALVLAPSLGTTMAMWDALLPDLTRNFRVVRFEHRGHGGSPAPEGPYAIADLGADVVTLLDRLRIERASFCGVSLGGMVGMWLAANAADRVDRLALICTSAFLPPASGWHSRAAVVRAKGMTAVTEAVLPRWFTRSYAARRPDELARVARMLQEVDPEGYASCCEAIAAWDFRAGLAAIRAPTLAIAGAQDLATPPSHAYAIGAGVSGARAVVIEQAAHLAVVERSEDVRRLLLDHLADHPPGDRSDRDRASRGEGIRRAVLGDAHVDRARANATAFSAPFQDLVNQFPWGDIWGRPGLSRGERSIATLTALAVLHHDHELAMHVAAALRNGLSVEQIREVLLHAGAYAGIPVANRALAVAERALQQASALDGGELDVGRARGPIGGQKA